MVGLTIMGSHFIRVTRTGWHIFGIWGIRKFRWVIKNGKIFYFVEFN